MVKELTIYLCLDFEHTHLQIRHNYHNFKLIWAKAVLSLRSIVYYSSLSHGRHALTTQSLHALTETTYYSGVNRKT